jgi:anti-sigma factor RsiW
MTHVTRDVITDLLPLYLAGEASAGSRALVEDYLRQHPDFAAQTREHAEQSAALLSAIATPSLAEAHEKAAFERTRRFNRYRSWIMGLAIAFSLVPFSIVITDDVRWVLLSDHPTEAVVLWAAGAVCWLAYYVLGRRMRSPR